MTPRPLQNKYPVADAVKFAPFTFRPALTSRPTVRSVVAPANAVLIAPEVMLNGL